MGRIVITKVVAKKVLYWTGFEWHPSLAQAMSFRTEELAAIAAEALEPGSYEFRSAL